MQTLTLDHGDHNVTLNLAKGLTYETPEGWATVFFDAAGSYYEPLDRFIFRAEANAFIVDGIERGIHIS